MSGRLWMLITLFLVCITASVSDIRTGKIYNKHLFYGGIIGAAGVLWYYFIHPYYVFPFLINLFMEAIIAFLLFEFKIWGAGDAKLWILFGFLFPFGDYYWHEYLLFPSLYILMFIFIVAYFYVLIETIVLAGKRRNDAKNEKKRNKPPGLIMILKNSVFYFFAIRIIYRICMFVFQEYYYANQIFFVLVGILLTSYLLNLRVNRTFKRVTIIAGACLWGYDMVTVLSAQRIQRIDILSLMITVVVMILKDGMAKYNYETIPTNQVKSGMILALSTVMQFKQSRVKGLPLFTDESTKSRITLEETEAIRRWEKSKNGEGNITIVKYLPFGIFMTIGLIVYIIWNCWWGL